MQQESSGVIYQRSTLATARIRDGASQTYLVGEKNIMPDHYQNGIDYGDNNYSMYTGIDKDTIRVANSTYALRPDQPGLHAPWSFGGPHPGTWQVVFCDGSVRNISYGIDPIVHTRLADRNDGQAVDATQF